MALNDHRSNTHTNKRTAISHLRPQLMRLMAGDWCEGNNGPKAESGPGHVFLKGPLTWYSVLLPLLLPPARLALLLPARNVKAKRCGNGLDNRETLCMNGFVIQRKNEKNNPSDSHVITTKLGPGLQGSTLLVRAHVDLIVGEVTQHTHVRKHAGFCLT